MGEVYRATDTKLNREVAIKLLPEAFAQDAERLARFVREAQVLACLNHPGIAAIYGLEDSHGSKALVLELVEGETLAERLKGGPLPSDEALAVGIQIAEALEAAHEKGIIHRDLKPSNVKITPSGKVKVLDFGLAKLIDGSSALPGQPASDDSPTLTAQHTGQGVILGTAAYMSPEQSRGKLLDKRTDIWSFGCLLFECLAGKRPFTGETVADTLGAVLHKDPDWSLLPPTTPPTIQLLLRKCLAKDRSRRLHDIADARVDLEHMASPEMGSSAMRVASQALTAELDRRQGIRWSILVPCALALVGGAWALFQVFYRTPPSHIGSVVQSYTLVLHPEAPLVTANPYCSISLSPDGSRVAYCGQREGVFQIYWKPIEEASFQPVPGGTRAFPWIMFSPKADRMAFWSQGGDLKLVSPEGGLPRTLVTVAQTLRGGHWAAADRLVYTVEREGLYEIPIEENSVPRLLLSVNKEKGEHSFHHPQNLPGGKAILFTVGGTNSKAFLDALELPAKKRKRLPLLDSFNPVYFPTTGHLVYGRDDVLWARHFDVQKLEFDGPEVSLLSDVGRDWMAGCHQFALANNGTLIYASGRQAQPRYQLAWIQGHDSPEILSAEPAAYQTVRLAPDGNSAVLWGPPTKRMLIQLPGGAVTHIPNADGKMSLFAYDGTNVFLNDVRSVGSRAVLRVRVDGTGQPEQLYQAKEGEPGEVIQALDVSPDGRYLAFHRGSFEQGDIWLKDLQATDGPKPFLTSPAHEAAAKFSPDGRWLAYTANTTERTEVYVRNLTGGGLACQVSTNGGTNPVWSRDGARLYFKVPRGIMVAKLKTSEPLRFESPTLFAQGRFIYSGNSFPANYDVGTTPKGDRLLMLKSIFDEPEPQYATQLNAIVHFDELIRRSEKKARGESR